MSKKVIMVAAVMLAVLAALLLWPFSTYDLSRVHPSLRSLQQPYRSVTAEYYLDGGSVGVDIIDRDGQRLQLAVPIDDGPSDTRTHHRLFIGATYASRTGAIEVAFTPDTKSCMAEIIDRYATPGPDRDGALMALRGNPHDYAEIYTRVFLSRVMGR